jgi:hypothetical protein
MTGARGKQIEVSAMVAAIALLVAAIAVRGIRGEAPLAPQDRPRSVDALAQPMQLLGRGAKLRIDELTARISEPLSAAWRASYRLPFELRGCPALSEWLDGRNGQSVERLIADLRRGSRDEALASLALTLQIARATEWEPGLLARTQNAERLGALVQEWLRAWGERGCDDATLAEPTLAATLFYGRVMRIAAEAPPVGRYDAPYERAKAFLEGLLLDQQGQATHLGIALKARHPSAANGFTSSSDALAGLGREAAQLFPELDGECDG